MQREPSDAVRTTISNSIPYMFTALPVPGMLPHNNDSELSIHCNAAAVQNRVNYPDGKGARNFAEMQTFAATCEKNGISGIPPPIFRAAEGDCDDGDGDGDDGDDKQPKNSQTEPATASMPHHIFPATTIPNPAAAGSLPHEPGHKFDPSLYTRTNCTAISTL